MARCWIGDKPFSEPILNRFTNIYIYIYINAALRGDELKQCCSKSVNKGTISSCKYFRENEPIVQRLNSAQETTVIWYRFFSQKTCEYIHIKLTRVTKYIQVGPVFDRRFLNVWIGWDHEFFIRRIIVKNINKYLHFKCKLGYLWGSWNSHSRKVRIWTLIQYKIWSYQYTKSHWRDKMVIRLSYLHNGISYTGKMASLYWISPLLVVYGQNYG